MVHPKILETILKHRYSSAALMASAGLGHGGAGSSRSANNGFKVSSSSVDWLGREMLEMRLRDRVEPDDDRVCVRGSSLLT